MPENKKKEEGKVLIIKSTVKEKQKQEKEKELCY